MLVQVEWLREYCAPDLGAAELAERLERARIPYAPLRRPDQLVDDPHLNASDQWIATPLPGRPPAKLPKI